MEIMNVAAGATRFSCNAYLITGSNPTLVDAGTKRDVDDVIADHVDELETVVLTHQHRDHVAELSAVLDRFDPVVACHGNHPERDQALSDGDRIRLGETIYQAVHTPGHAKDHLSFISDDRIFSGDIVVYNDGAFEDGSFGRTDMAGQSRETLLESLDKLLTRLSPGVQELYAGHGDSYNPTQAQDTVYTVIERARERAARFDPKYPDE
jgi:hydroxyacylglutathione hydrolase